MTRCGYLATTCFAVTLTGAALDPIAPTLLWNASASAPIGLYAIQRTRSLEVADLVALAAPEMLAAFMAERGYLPRGIPLLKRVAGVAGQQVCRIDALITVDGAQLGEALARDRLGRDLPVWQGCRRIAEDQIFVMNVGFRDSFDGRYFGLLPADTVVGRARPLWITADSGHLE
jgi:conjugative transfer signal peptidase TraF